MQRAIKVEDVIEQEAKELREELTKMRITCKESDAKMHSQQEHSELSWQNLTNQNAQQLPMLAISLYQCLNLFALCTQHCSTLKGHVTIG